LSPSSARSSPRFYRDRSRDEERLRRPQGSLAVTSPTDRALGPLRVHGEVDDGFGPVMDVFDRNFRERGDLGAVRAVYVGGRKAYLSNQMGGITDARANLLAAAVRSCLRDELR
jgi:hypothetical protein